MSQVRTDARDRSSLQPGWPVREQVALNATLAQPNEALLIATVRVQGIRILPMEHVYGVT